MRAMWGAAIGVLMCLAIGDAGAAEAATIAVTSTADSGAGSLRAALAAATDGDVITIGTGQITLTSGTLIVDKQVTIVGRGPRDTVIDGGGSSRVFTVKALQVGIAYLRVTHGNGTGDGVANMGGGILVRSGGELSLYGAEVSGNAITGTGGLSVYGGGVAAASGASPAALIVSQSLIRDNIVTAQSSPAAAYGGGIAALGTNTRFAVRSSTVTKNEARTTGTAAARGGGVSFQVASTSDEATPGISFFLGSIVGSTLVGNKAVRSGAGTGTADGGNIVHLAPTAGTTKNLHTGSTIVSGGVAVTNADCGGDANVLGGPQASLAYDGANLVGTPNPTVCPLTAFSSTPSITGDPQLATLQDNGGLTDSFRPAASSPVLGKGRATAGSCAQDSELRCLDQRGVRRKTAPDVGAVETHAPEITGAGAVAVKPTTATLTADVDGVGVAAGTYAFSYTPAGGATTALPAHDFAAADPTARTEPVTGLTPGVAYTVSVTATTADGSTTATGTFTPPLLAPTARTAAPSDVGPTTATLNGILDTNGVAGTFRFEYSSDDFKTVIATPDQAAAAADGDQPVSATVTGLVPDTFYSSRVKVTTSVGSAEGLTTGLFHTPFGPVVLTAGAKDITKTTASLFGTVEDGGHTDLQRPAFELATDAAFKTGRTVDTGGTVAAPTATAKGLLPGRLYYLRLNSGTRDGTPTTFTTRPTLLGALSVKRAVPKTAGWNATFTLGGSARVTLTLARRAVGRLRKGRCLPAPARGPVCTRYVGAGRAPVARTLASGPATLRIPLTVARRALPKGTYRVTLKAKGATETVTRVATFTRS